MRWSDDPPGHTWENNLIRPHAAPIFQKRRSVVPSPAAGFLRFSPSRYALDAVHLSPIRTDLFAQQRALAEAWARYCEGGEVIDFPVEVRSA